MAEFGGTDEEKIALNKAIMSNCTCHRAMVRVDGIPQEVIIQCDTHAWICNTYEQNQLIFGKRMLQERLGYNADNIGFITHETALAPIREYAKEIEKNV